MESQKIIFSDLENQALSLLEPKPHALLEHEGHKFRLHLRLWLYPSFALWRSWHIYRPLLKGNPYLLREVIWNQRLDLERVYNQLNSSEVKPEAKPSVGIRHLLLDTSEYEERLARLRIMSIPIFASSEQVTMADGDQYGLHLTSSANSNPVTWTNTPASWSDLDLWFKETMFYFCYELDKDLPFYKQ